MHGTGEEIRKLESDSLLQRGARDEFLLDEIVQKGDDAGRAGLYGGDMHAAILLVLDEGRIAAIGTPAEVLTAEMVSTVYGTKVLIERNPLSCKPHVILAAGLASSSAVNKKEEQ